MAGKDHYPLGKLMNESDTLKKRSRYLRGTCALFIFLLTCLVYTPALKNDFVNWDDGVYVYENTNIQSFNSHSLYWMLTSFHASNWHPLTWLTHAIDCALWGLDSSKHHLTNILLHGFNSLLLFFLAVGLILRTKVNLTSSHLSRSQLRILTHVLLAGSVTALLFGLHPLHVESVAWVSERKDLLCAFFVLLSILSYLSYTSSSVFTKRSLWFMISLLFFSCALMSKPMAVSLPAILLLLDLYPLRRLEPYLTKNLPLLLEKIPFFVLSIASSTITIIAQHAGGAVMDFKRLPLPVRLLNAAHSPIFYLEKMIWPVELVPFYPFPKQIYPWDAHYIISGGLVLAITGICLWGVKQGKYLFFTVWSYYVITLLPVIGIIQVGSQAAADRYTYLPSISLFLLIGIGTAWLWQNGALMREMREMRGLMLFFTFIALSLLGYLTVKQIKTWQNSEILWSYVISAFPEKIPTAHTGLGNVHFKKGRLDDAIVEYKRALAIDPNYSEAHYNLGITYANNSMLDEAISEFKKALIINPNFTEAHFNLGVTYKKKDMLDEAISEYKKALNINPNLARAHNNLGLAYIKKGKLDESISEYKKALAINPNYAKAHYNLGIAYYYQAKYTLAIIHLDQALELGYTINSKLVESLKPYR